MIISVSKVAAVYSCVCESLSYRVLASKSSLFVFVCGFCVCTCSVVSVRPQVREAQKTIQQQTAELSTCKELLTRHTRAVQVSSSSISQCDMISYWTVCVLASCPSFLHNRELIVLTLAAGICAVCSSFCVATVVWWSVIIAAVIN